VKLSPRESQALSFIALTIERTGKPPFQYEIAAHLGTKSRGFVCRVLNNLEAKGLLRRRIYEIRGLEVIKQELRAA
jgi:SOS-response transcriptional repressor LexA